MRVRNLTGGIFHLIVVNSAGTPIGNPGKVSNEGFAVVRSTDEVTIVRPLLGSLKVRIMSSAAPKDQMTSIHGGGGTGVPIDEKDGDGNRLETQLKIRNKTKNPLPWELKDNTRAVVEAGEIKAGRFQVFSAAADVGIIATGGVLSLEIWEELPSA